MGERTQTSSFTSAEMRGPRDGARQRARGRLPKRMRHAVAQAASAAGVGVRSRDAGVPVATSTR